MLLESIQELMPAITKINHTNLSIKLVNGSEIYFKGADNKNSLRGRGIDFLVVDEAAFLDPDLWPQVLRPALSDKQGRAIFLSTANGRNHFHEMYKTSNYASKKNWNGYLWPTRLNPLISENELEDAKTELSDMDYRQEYEGDFVTKAGLIYSDFSEENITDVFEPDRREHTFYLGVDFGFSNPTAICFFAVDDKTQTVYQFDEIYVMRTPIAKIVDLVLEKLKKHKLRIDDISNAYTDPAGNADELSSGISPVDHMRSRGFKVLNKGSNVAPGLALVRSFILNAAGKRRFFIHRRCTNTIKSFYGYSYKLKYLQPSEEPDKESGFDHAPDAARYFFVNKFDNAKYFFDSLEPETTVAVSTSSPIMKRCSICRKPFISRTPKNLPPYSCEACLEQKELEHAS